VLEVPSFNRQRILGFLIQHLFPVVPLRSIHAMHHDIRGGETSGQTQLHPGSQTATVVESCGFSSILLPINSRTCDGFFKTVP